MKSTPPDTTPFRNETRDAQKGGKHRAGGLPGRLFRRALHGVRLAVVFFLISTVSVVLIYRFVPPPLTPLMVLRLWDQFRASEPLTLKKDWTPLAAMSPWMPAAVITAEDQRFYGHNGFDFESIRKAQRHNERARERAERRGGRPGRLRGASTISQQTAKNVFLWPARSWTRKGLEVWFTFLIETLWPKERILEVYLNVAETGNGLYGAPIAARHYYGRNVVALNRSQAAGIAAILPKPRAWSPVHPPLRVIRKQARLLRQMPTFYRRYE